MGREDGGQNLKLWQIHARAEAPRQRRKEGEPRPRLVRRSYWIWLRTGSVYGIPVTPNHTHAWFMCGTGGANGFLFGQKVSVTTYRRSERNCSQLRSPSGEQTRPKSRKGIVRDLGELAHPYQNNLPVDEPEVGGVIVVRGRESRLHGEGHQPVPKGVIVLEETTGNLWGLLYAGYSQCKYHSSVGREYYSPSDGKGTGGKPDDGKLSRPVWRAAGGKDSF